MKVLHTSDWHLGRMLYGQKRHDEFESFLSWLTGFIQHQQIDVLMVAGDVFDTTTPGNRVQELYFQFLSRIRSTSCRHVIVTAGNHDSPTLLNAPKELLRYLNIHITGEITDSPADEVITLFDADNQPEAIVCAVPFLRDKDVRKVDEGENSQDKTQNLMNGIASHYYQVGEHAYELLQQYGDIPVLAMGHLFTKGGTTLEGDGTRDLYVGTAVQVGADIFPACFDYVALGHLHSAQLVGGKENIRYSGSPLPMGFNEANQQKKVIVVEFEGKKLNIAEHNVPVFMPLIRISGNLEQIVAQIRSSKEKYTDAYLEIECTASELHSDLTEQVTMETEDSALKVLRLKNKQIENQVLARAHETEELEDLDPKEVFERCMLTHTLEEDLKVSLRNCYLEILAAIETEENLH